MAFELSKSEKNLARVLIDKGVDAEFKTVLEQAAVIITQWHKGSIDNRTAYHQLFKNIKEQDKRIANRYDGLTGSRYLSTVAGIYIDGQITEADIEDFSEESKAFLNNWLRLS